LRSDDVLAEAALAADISAVLHHVVVERVAVLAHASVNGV
jgi:hypothetical protein